MGSSGGGAGQITDADPGSTVFTPIGVTYWTDKDGWPQLITTWGSHGTATTGRSVQTSTFVATPPIANPQFALRFFDAVPGNAGGIEIDNLEIVSVPEPASCALLGLLGVSLLAHRQRRSDFISRPGSTRGGQ